MQSENKSFFLGTYWTDGLSDVTIFVNRSDIDSSFYWRTQIDSGFSSQEYIADEIYNYLSSWKSPPVASPAKFHMEKFLTKKDNHTAVNVTPADRVRNYPKGMLHADDGFLFCSTCNIVIDHTRKHKIDKHLESAAHVRKG